MLKYDVVSKRRINNIGFFFLEVKIYIVIYVLSQILDIETFTSLVFV